MDFHAWDKDRLATYLEFLLHNYRVADAFWFLRVEERHGLGEACQINELVWGKVGQLGARDIKRLFRIERTGLAGFLEALRLWPWTIITGYQIDARDIDRADGEIIIQAPHCPPQVARLKRGLGEYDCKAMHRVEFENFAREIDPRIRVECLFAPPDPHPGETFCRWRFRMDMP